MTTPTRTRPRYERKTTSPWTTIGWIIVGGMVTVALFTFIAVVLFGVGVAASM